MVARVYLLSSFADPRADTHWASPYAALRRSFVEHPSDEYMLVDSAEDADLILVCPRPRNPLWPIETLRGGIAWRYRDKCVVVSTDDDPTMTHQGFYTSLRRSQAISPYLRGGIYPCVSFGNPPGELPADDVVRLFSFLGSFATHPVRRRIGELAARQWQSTGVEYEVRDTSRTQQDAGTHEFKSAYLKSLRESRFVLCPRGMSPSSLRLFEAMKAGRVPVVISDEWVPPAGIAWDRFTIRVGERDVAALPRILSGEAKGFTERARAARAAWRDHFEADVLARTVTRWGVALLRERASAPARARHGFALARQLVRWRFLRRGIASELIRPLRAAGRRQA